MQALSGSKGRMQALTGSESRSTPSLCPWWAMGRRPRSLAARRASGIHKGRAVRAFAPVGLSFRPAPPQQATAVSASVAPHDEEEMNALQAPAEQPNLLLRLRWEGETWRCISPEPLDQLFPPESPEEHAAA